MRQFFAYNFLYGGVLGASNVSEKCPRHHIHQVGSGGGEFLFVEGMSFRRNTGEVVPFEWDEFNTAFVEEGDDWVSSYPANAVCAEFDRYPQAAVGVDPPPHSVQSFEDGDLVTGQLKISCGGEASDSSADDDDGAEVGFAGEGCCTSGQASTESCHGDCEAGL